MNNTIAKERFLSLDVFRGLTVCFMIIVNTPGSGDYAYMPLNHAHWNGFTPTDLVFPTFLFVVGNAVSFSIKKYEAIGTSAVLAKVLKRTLIIFLLGYLMYWFPFFHRTDTGWAFNPISHTRIFGVLQRIALAYCFGTLIIHFLGKRAAIIISVIILIAYWFLLMGFGIPGRELTMTGNAVLRLDKWVMGDAHLYHGEGIPFDPEGILSTLPAIVNVIAGYLAGDYLQRKGKTYETISQFFVVGSFLVILALFWNISFPINKKIWTSSFVLNTVGIDLIILGILVYWIEMKNHSEGAWFFTIPGKNPLFVYLLSELLIVVFFIINPDPDHDLYEWLYIHIFQYAGLYFGSLLQAIAYMLLCWSVGWWLNKRKIYIRV